MKMRKLRILALITAIMLLCTACGGKAESAASAAPAANDTSAAAPAPAASTESVAASSAIDTSAATAEAPAEDLLPAPGDGVTKETIQNCSGEATRYITPASGQFAKKDKSTLNVGTVIAITNGDPAMGSDSPFYQLCYETMLNIDPNTGEFIPGIITEWNFSDDYSSLDITIRDDVKFHNGEPLTMDDILYTLERNSDAVRSRLVDHEIFLNIDFEKTVVQDDYHATLILKQPTTRILDGMARSYSGVLCKKHMEEAGEDNAFWDNCDGCGPYKVESIVNGDRYNLVRNDDYFGEKPNFDKCVIRFYGEPSTMYVDYETGDLDIVISPLPSDVMRVINGNIENTICDIYPMLCTYLIVFNDAANDVLKDVRVREAISLALNSDDLAYAGYEFLAEAPKSIIPLGCENRYITEHEYNVEKARELIKETGYSAEELTFVWGTSMLTANTNIAEAAQYMLADIGVTLDIQTFDTPTHIMNLIGVGPCTYDMTVNMFQAANMDYNGVLAQFCKSTGAMGVSVINDDELDQLMYKALYSVDKEEQSKLYEEAQQAIAEQYLAPPVADCKVAIIYRDYIDGMEVVGARMPLLKDVKLAY